MANRQTSHGIRGTPGNLGSHDSVDSVAREVA